MVREETWYLPSFLLNLFSCLISFSLQFTGTLNYWEDVENWCTNQNKGARFKPLELAKW